VYNNKYFQDRRTILISLSQIIREVKLCIPNSQTINRGGYRVDELMEACRGADFTDVVVVNETRGQPDAMVVSHLPFGPTAYFTLSNCVLRHDIAECTPASQAYPHLILDNMTTSVGKRVGKILQALYPVPRDESKRVLTFANRDDFISFRHHMVQSSSNGPAKGGSHLTIKEAGPRFEMQPYEVWPYATYIHVYFYVVSCFFSMLPHYACPVDSFGNTGARACRKRMGTEAIYEHCTEETNACLDLLCQWSRRVKPAAGVNPHHKGKVAIFCIRPIIVLVCTITITNASSAASSLSIKLSVYVS
jgi:rRNA maturation protein Rpf1